MDIGVVAAVLSMIVSIVVVQVRSSFDILPQLVSASVVRLLHPYRAISLRTGNCCCIKASVFVADVVSLIDLLIARSPLLLLSMSLPLPRLEPPGIKVPAVAVNSQVELVATYAKVELLTAPPHSTWLRPTLRPLPAQWPLLSASSSSSPLFSSWL